MCLGKSIREKEVKAIRFGCRFWWQPVCSSVGQSTVEQCQILRGGGSAGTLERPAHSLEQKLGRKL